MFAFSLNGQQVTCDDVGWGFGEIPLSGNCFEKRIAVYFTNSVVGAAYFPYCTYVDGNLSTEFVLDIIPTGAKINGVVMGTIGSLNTASPPQRMDDGSYEIRIADNNDASPMYLPTFGSPLFYVDLLPESPNYSLKLLVNHSTDTNYNPYYVDTNCSTTTECTALNGQFSFVGATPITCAGDQVPYDLEFFVDVDNADVVYDATTNESVVTVKARTTLGTSIVSFDRVGFSVSLSNLLAGVTSDDNGFVDGELWMNFDVDGNITLKQLGNSFIYDATPSTDYVNIHFQDEPFTNFAEAKLFEIRIKAPAEPLSTGGTVNFDFDYTRADFAYGYEGECCSPASVSNMLMLGDPFNDYNSVCDGSTPFELYVTDSGLPNSCPGVFYFPVSFRPYNGAAVQDIDFTTMNIEMEIMGTPGISIDATETLNSLNATIAAADPNALSINGNTITLNFTVYSGVILSTDAELFTIHLASVTNEEMSDVYVRHSDYSWDIYGSLTQCVSHLTEDYTAGDETLACSGQHGEIKRITGDLFSSPDLQVRLSDQNADMSMECAGSDAVITNQGEFNFSHCSTLTDFSVGVCDITSNYLENVSTFDLILIQKFILGLTSFVGWQRIAADASVDGTVSALDLIVLRRLILGIDTELMQNWRFVEIPYDDSALTGNPTTIGGNVGVAFQGYYNNLRGVNCNLGFTAIKVGDVNNQILASPKPGQPNDKFYITVVDKGLDSKGDFSIEFVPEDFNAISAFEFTIQPDLTKLDYYDWTVGDLGYVDADVFYKKNGEVNIAWFDKSGYGKYLSSSKSMFRLNFTPQVTTYGVNDIALDNTQIFGHVYRSDGKEYDIELIYDTGTGKKMGNNSSSNAKVQEQEPSLNVTRVGGQSYANLFVSESQTVSFKIYNIQGQMLSQQSTFVDEGNNLIPLSMGFDWPSGIYLLQARTQKGSLSTTFIK